MYWVNCESSLQKARPLYVNSKCLEKYFIIAKLTCEIQYFSSGYFKDLGLYCGGDKELSTFQKVFIYLFKPKSMFIDKETQIWDNKDLKNALKIPINWILKIPESKHLYAELRWNNPVL